MKISIQQLKRLVREAVEEVSAGGVAGPVSPLEEEGDDAGGMSSLEGGMTQEETAALQEAVATAYRAGLRRGKAITERRLLSVSSRTGSRRR